MLEKVKAPQYTSLVAQTVKRLPTMRETWVQSLGQEDLLEKGMATHSSTLAWKILWTEKPGRLQSMGLQRVTQLSDFTFTLTIRRGFCLKTQGISKTAKSKCSRKVSGSSFTPVGLDFQVL